MDFAKIESIRSKAINSVYELDMPDEQIACIIELINSLHNLWKKEYEDLLHEIRTLSHKTLPKIDILDRLNGTNSS